MTDTATKPAETETPAPAVAPQTDQSISQETDAEALPEGEAAEAPDDSEEIDWEGKKFRVAKPIKEALMLKADYTRKTQEVAEQRRALDAERTRFGEQAKAQQEFLRDHAKLVSIDEQLEAYRKVDWDALQQNDPGGYDAHFRRFTLLRDSREIAAGQLREKEQAKSLEAQRENAKRAEQATSYLAREVPDWSPGNELDQKLTKFALDSGFTPEELAGMAYANPRAVKVLYLAFKGQQAVAVSRASATAPKPEAVPVKTVTSSRTAPSGPRDSDTVEDWMAKRNAQLRKTRA